MDLWLLDFIANFMPVSIKIGLLVVELVLDIAMLLQEFELVLDSVAFIPYISD